MSPPFGVAVAILEGTVTLDHLDTEWLQRSDVRELARRVRVDADPNLDHVDGIDSGTVLPADLTLTTRDGRQFRRRIVFQRGDARNPLTDEDLKHKFYNCAGRVLEPARVTELHDRLSDLSAVGSVRDLAALLRAS